MDFDRISSLYDREIVPIWGRPFSSLLLRHLPPVLSGHVVEIGCGTGYLAIELAERLQGKSRILAFEPSHEMLELAFQRGESVVHQKKVFFQHHPLDRFRFVDGVIDLVFSNLGLYYLDDTEPLLLEISRILKAGGKAFFTLPLRGSFASFLGPVQYYLRQRGEIELSRRLESDILRFPSPEEILYLFRRVGFEDLSLELEPFHMIFPRASTMLASAFIRYHFLEPWFPLLRDLSPEALLSELEILFDQQRQGREITLVVQASCLQGRKPIPSPYP